MDLDAAKPPTALDAASVLADVYAEALLSLLGDQEAEAVAAELEALLAVMDEVDGFEDLLAGGMLRRRELSALVHRVFDGRCSRTAFSFLAVLARRGRLGMLRRTARRFRALLDARQGKVHVVATTAAPMDTDRQEQVRQMVAETLGIEPIMEFTVDEKLLGGMVLRAGDHLYDASAATRLRGLARRVSNRLGTRF